jgi:hypothetical protein
MPLCAYIIVIKYRVRACSVSLLSYSSIQITLPEMMCNLTKPNPCLQGRAAVTLRDFTTAVSCLTEALDKLGGKIDNPSLRAVVMAERGHAQLRLKDFEVYLLADCIK